MSLIKHLLTEKVTLEDVSDRLLRFLSKNDFNEIELNLSMSDYYLSEGMQALVLYSDKYPTSVLRIEKGSKSSDFKKVVDHNMKHVVDVKYYNEFRKQSHEVISITIMEKLEEIPFDVKMGLVDLRNYYSDNIEKDNIPFYHFYSILFKDFSILKKIYDRVVQSDNYSLDLPYEEVEKYFKQTMIGLRELYDNGIYQFDVSPVNTMKDPKTGDYKLIDVYSAYERKINFAI